MNYALETSQTTDGSGVGRVMNGRIKVAEIFWRSVAKDGILYDASRPDQVVKLTRLRLQDEQKGGPYASPAKAKAIAMLMQVEAELNGGQQTLDDGTPIFGASE